MSKVERRLRELGISIPQASPSPAGAYVPAVISGQMVYTAGQLPLVDGELAFTGKVGAEVSLVDARQCARVCALNALSAAQELLGSLNRVTSVVRVAGFVASDAAFTAQPAVVNGASDLLQEIFEAAGVHARTAVGVAVLPLNAPVEVELMLEFR